MFTVSETLGIRSLQPANPASRHPQAGLGPPHCCIYPRARPHRAPPPCKPRPSLALTCRSSPGGCPRPVGPHCWSSSEPGSTWAWLSNPTGFCPACRRTLVLTGRRRTPPSPRACSVPDVRAPRASSRARVLRAGPRYHSYALITWQMEKSENVCAKPALSFPHMMGERWRQGVSESAPTLQSFFGSTLRLHPGDCHCAHKIGRAHV